MTRPAHAPSVPPRCADVRAIAGQEALEALFATAPMGLGLVDRQLRWVRLNEALASADWFGPAHAAAVLEAAGKPGVDDRVTAVRTLIAEETGVAMLIGVAVGYELAHELMRDKES